MVGKGLPTYQVDGRNPLPTTAAKTIANGQQGIADLSSEPVFRYQEILSVSMNYIN
jgi:hypothetical protein